MCTPNLKDRYVNFYTDFAFKKLFGTEMNKELLISFLNALLKGKEEIVDLTYKNPAHLGAVASDRKAVFDENELRDYRESQKDYWDMYSIMKTQMDKGIAIGEERGIERKNLENITRMRAKGLDDTTIADLLDFPLEYVQQH